MDLPSRRAAMSGDKGAAKRQGAMSSMRRQVWYFARGLKQQRRIALGPSLWIEAADDRLDDRDFASLRAQRARESRR